MSKATPIFILIFSAILTSCVSVKLSPNTTAKRAEGVSYSEPGSPFSKQSRDDVDASWINEKNGNVISFLSDCKDPSDPPLDSIVQGLVSGIRDLNFESRETVTMQGREGRRVLATGKVDGVASQMDLLVFKRNQCIFILGYVGVASSFATDRQHFNKFVSGFRAP